MGPKQTGRPSRSERDHRARVAKETLAALEAGFYTAELSGECVDISSQISSSVGGTFVVGANRSGVPAPRSKHKTVVDHADDDTLVAAERLAEWHGLSVVALNFASAKHPGGGWLNGAEAQVHACCMCAACMLQ